MPNITRVCRQCHAAAFDGLVSKGMHPAAASCVDCHMPKRRTEDVVHVVMTDHLIQRRPPSGNLLAELANATQESPKSIGERWFRTTHRAAANGSGCSLPRPGAGAMKNNLRVGVAELARLVAVQQPREPSGTFSSATPGWPEASR